MNSAINRAVFMATIFAALIPAQERRITPVSVVRKQALVIGNAAYLRAPLKNPIDDARAMESTLQKLGFEVRTLRNLDLPQMEAAIDEFTADLAAGSLGFFYFSGHGVQVNFTNYLLPVDFAAASESDVKYKAYPATRIQEKMEATGARLRILVLDACRNNPFRYKREALGGLAAMTVNAEGTLIAFATGDNNTADDTNSYTKYLVPALLTPGLHLREAFQKAKEEVYASSRRAQNPSIYENIVGEYYLVSPPVAVVPQPGLDAAAEAWNLVKDSKHPEDFDDFARAFPKSELGTTARLRAVQLRRGLPTAPEAGRTKVNPKDGLKYVWIPPGTFTMGCSAGDTECNDDEKPPHQVTISKGFWLGQTPATQQAYERVMGKNPSFITGASLPVVGVNWDDAEAYCKAVGMRQPTEAEWEYAARAGSAAARYGNLDAIAWYSDNSGGKTHEVGQKQANAFELYDMLGNVFQWVADWHGPYSPGAQSDPPGAASGQYRALRGGSWFYLPERVRVSSRFRLKPTFRDGGIGFRCAGE